MTDFKGQDGNVRGARPSKTATGGAASRWGASLTKGGPARPVWPSRAVLLLRRWPVLHNLLSDVFGHHVALSFVVTNEEKLNSSVATEAQKNAAS